MLKRWYREAVAVACAAATALAVMGSGGWVGADGVLFDLTVAAHALWRPDDRRPPQRPVAVIALDGRSLASDELTPVPRVLMAAQWAKLLEGVFGAGARAVGFDIIFGYSANAFIANHDRPFLAALSEFGDRVVLGRSLDTPIAEPFAFLLDESSIGYVELEPDGDGVFRRVHAAQEVLADGGTGTTRVPGLAAQVLARAGVPVSPESVLLAPRDALESIPTYSMIDVLRCAKSDPAMLARAFEGRIVLIGTTLPEEDRKMAPDRFLPRLGADLPPVNPAPDECWLPRLGASNPSVPDVPGVHIHAAAVDAVAGGRLPTTVPVAVTAVIAGGLALAAAWTAFALPPVSTVAALVLAMPVLFAGGVGLLAAGIWLPIALAGGGMVGGGLAAYLARYVVEDRRRRRIETAFGRYLAPQLVQRLAESEAPLRLGGEARDVTIMFADLSGFTALSGRVSAAELMAVTNRYLALIADAVDATGGYVDKFIGDAVMAMWGAPADNPDHALDAVRAALQAAARVAAERAADAAKGGTGFSVKIGVNSGMAIVGNVGAERRFNYTAVGEAVNVASRLEGLPGVYACAVVIGPETARRADGHFLLCEIDHVRVKGKAEPIPVFEPLAAATDAQREVVRRYAEALADYRGRRFVEAHATWVTLAPHGPAGVMAARAAGYRDCPPPSDWDGVWTMSTK